MIRHIVSGLCVLKCSDYAFGREHPLLAKMLAAAPLPWSNPPMSYAREVYCIWLEWNGQPEEGLSECSVARNLALADGNQKEAQKITERMKDIALQDEEAYHIVRKDK